VTVKVVKKVKKCVVKKEDEHPFQIIEKTMYNCSFFNFFNPPSSGLYSNLYILFIYYYILNKILLYY